MTDDLIETLVPLQPRYTPDRIINRSDEQEAIAAALNSDGGELSNLYIHGPRGTGKTLLIKNALSTLADDIQACYVSCIDFDTQYKILKRICHAISGQQAADGHHTSDLQRRIGELTKAVPTVLILDDIDFLLLNDGEDLLYFLSRLDPSHQIGIILVSSNGAGLRSQLEERTYSSLYPQSLAIEPYPGEQIYKIFSHRAENAFTPHTLHSGALEYISASTQNVTFGLHWLKTAAIQADSVITEEMAVETYKRAYESYVGSLLQEFSRQHQFLYKVIQDIAKEDTPVRSGRIYSEYGQNCRSTSMDKVSKRTISDYLKHLELLDLIHADYHYGGQEGKTRQIRLKRPV